MALFTMLNVVSSRTDLTKIDYKDVEFFSGVEGDSKYHWILGISNTALSSRINYLDKLTVGTIAPTWTFNGVITDAYESGLITPVTDDSQVLLLTEVISFKVNEFGGVGIINGNMSSTTSSSGGGSVYLSNDFHLYLIYHGIVSNVKITTEELIVGQEYTLIIHRDWNSTNKETTVLLDGEVIFDNVSTSTYITTDRKLGLGNCYYNTGNTPEIEFSEMVVFNKQFDAEGLALLNAKAKSRINSRT
ncbi:hypothetical protein TSMG0052 [Halocynthia phage JM-2012]|uniref:hypothetical protein n=1 Tax=Halocynthia phage JM-2012 TaxID=1173297 RepID=UPI00025C6908|nr:hypothetical protein TSMG0052 [Halocynthia phage JM-2012]AFI55335.1 hypothetical protein TSMG0052 [Halocynthia phage JM-2012]